MKNTSSVPPQPNPLAPLMAPWLTTMGSSYLALLVLLLILKNVQVKKTTLADGRWATTREVKQGEKLGRRQIAQGIPNQAALKLERLILPDLQPAVAVVGRSRGGKTRSFVDPGLKNALQQGWTNLVLDVKGNLMRKHAAYAYSQGYDVYVYAPGFPYSDGLNFLKFMSDPADAKKAEEIATVLEANFGEPGARKDNFFSPQGVALLKLVFMLAKASPFPDLLSAWKFLSLPDLAGRLEAAHHYDRFNCEGGIGSWIGEAAVALRSVAHAEETSVGIVGSAVTNFQTMIERSILPSLIDHTMPLDLPGKQIIFFQIDEQNEAATAPLVATAIHMLVKRNLNARVRRENTLGLWLDEFDSIALPDIKNWINRFAEYGLVATLSYQSDSQVKLRYSRDYADSILSSCGTKIFFNTGHPQTADKFSQSLGSQEVNYHSESRSYGKNYSRSLTEHKQKAPLITGAAINRFRTGECIILSPGYQYRPHKLKVKIDPKNDRLWHKCSSIWDDKILPYKLKKPDETEPMEVSLINRQVVAEATLPTAVELKAVESNPNQDIEQ